MELPTAAYVILGMLRLGARSGYDIKRRVDVSTRHFSTISPAQIYPLLKRLERGGLVRGRAQPQGRRQRLVYALTPKGDDALAEWLRGSEALSLEVRDLGLLKLFFADAVGRDDALAIVRAMLARSERILDELRRQSEPAAREVGRRGERMPLLTLRYGIAMHEAWLEVCRELERELAPRPRRRRRRS